MNRWCPKGSSIQILSAFCKEGENIPVSETKVYQFSQLLRKIHVKMTSVGLLVVEKAFVGTVWFSALS